MREQEVQMSRRRQHGGILLAVGFVFGLAFARAARSQEPTPKPESASTFTLHDDAFGFDLTFPESWVVDASPFSGPSRASGVARARSADAGVSMQIMVFEQARPQPFPNWLDFFAGQLRATPGVTSAHAWTDSSALRPAAFVRVAGSLTTESGPTRLTTWYYCVELDSGLRWVLSLAQLGGAGSSDASAPEAAPAAPALLTETIRSLQVRYDPLVAEALRAATARGRLFLADGRLQRAARELRIDTQELHYALEVEHKPVGFVSRQFSRDLEPLTRPGARARPKEGLRVREKRWEFGHEGQARYETLDLFASLDGATDLAERVVCVVPAEPGAPVQRTHEQCIREGDVLIACVLPTTPRAERAPSRPLALSDAYLSQAWARLLPALLIDQPDPLPGFQVLDWKTGGLVPVKLAPLGERPLPGGGDQRAKAFELRRGFAPLSIQFVDAYGNLLRQERPGETLQRCDAAAIEARFGARRDAALRRIHPPP